MYFVYTLQNVRHTTYIYLIKYIVKYIPNKQNYNHPKNCVKV